MINRALIPNDKMRLRSYVLIFDKRMKAIEKCVLIKTYC